MPELHLPWMELSILISLLGVIWLAFVRDSDTERSRCIIICSLVLLCTTGEWLDFATLHSFEAHDHWDFIVKLFGKDFFVIDELSAPLLPLSALLYLAIVLSTLRTKVSRFPFGWTLVSEALLISTLSCKSPWGIIIFLSLATIPPWIELKKRGKTTNVYVLHMSLFVVLMVAGWSMIEPEKGIDQASFLPVALLSIAVLLRSGIVPVHCWMTDLFEKATFGTALLYVTPMAGAYAAVRLILPVSPGWALTFISYVSLFTAVYAACMALVQREARRFFCYLFLSNSSLVLVGLEIATPIGLTGALCVWLSVGISLAGFGLTLRAIEARTGRLTLADFNGLYEHAPTLAIFFLLTGLASIGFPGTIGFIGTELLIEGAVGVYPFVGTIVVVAAALNGIAILHAYFRVFTGTTHNSSISLRIRFPERIAVLFLTVLIIGGGLYPQPGVTSRYHAATAILNRRMNHGSQMEDNLHMHNDNHSKSDKNKEKHLDQKSLENQEQ